MFQLSYATKNKRLAIGTFNWTIEQWAKSKEPTRDTLYHHANTVRQSCLICLVDMHTEGIMYLAIHNKMANFSDFTGSEQPVQSATEMIYGS